MSILKEGKKDKPPKKGKYITPEEAFIEMLERKGALKTKNSVRGARFIHGLFAKAYGKSTDALRAAIQRGENIEQNMEGKARQHRRLSKRKFRGVSDDRIMSIIREDKKLGQLANRLFKT